MTVSAIRPGYLVSLNTSITGNTRYIKKTVESRHITERAEERESWQTTRIVADADEARAASEIRNKARYLIARICAHSDFGYIAPLDKRAELEEAIEEARDMAEAFNATANYTEVKVRVIFGMIEDSDVEAAAAIASEVRELMRAMEEGLEDLDVEAVRKAANKAKQMGQILTNNARERVEEVVQVAREAARKIVKAGETIGVEIDEAILEQIAQARTSFLDFDQEPVRAQRPSIATRAIDFDMAV